MNKHNKILNEISDEFLRRARRLAVLKKDKYMRDAITAYLNNPIRKTFKVGQYPTPEGNVSPASEPLSNELNKFLFKYVSGISGEFHIVELVAKDTPYTIYYLVYIDGSMPYVVRLIKDYKNRVSLNNFGNPASIVRFLQQIKKESSTLSTPKRQQGKLETFLDVIGTTYNTNEYEKLITNSTNLTISLMDPNTTPVVPVADALEEIETLLSQELGTDVELSPQGYILKLGDFDEIDSFDNDYLKVRRANKYNLIDSEGNYLSDKWFDSINKKADSSEIEATMDKDDVKITHTYQDVKSIKTENKLLNLVDNSEFLSFIKASDIIILETPIVITGTNSRKITIVANVTYNGKQYLLGKDGKLYNEDGHEYDPSEMAAKNFLDILNKLAYKLCSRFDCNYKYDSNDDKYMIWANTNTTEGKRYSSLNQDNKMSDLSNLDYIYLAVDTYRIDTLSRSGIFAFLRDELDFIEGSSDFARVEKTYNNIRQLFNELRTIENYINRHSTKNESLLASYALRDFKTNFRRLKAINEMAVNKSQIGDFDQLYPFSKKYIKVRRGNLFNLIDAANGKYMSDVWFDELSKNSDGTIKTSRKAKSETSNRQVQREETYSDIGTFIGAPIILRATCNLSIIRNIINTVNIDNVFDVEPYSYTTADNINTTIIAKVIYKGKNLLLSEDGKLYDKDGNEFIISKAYGINGQNMMVVVPYKLKQTLENNFVEFIFTKKDGTHRLAFGTTNEDFLDNMGAPEKPQVYGFQIQFFDCEKSEWRAVSAKKVNHADVVIINTFNSKRVMEMHMSDDREEIMKNYAKLVAPVVDNTELINVQETSIEEQTSE